jgi:hypothetical protein
VRQNILYRFGTNYASSETGEILRIGGRTILWQECTPDGRVLFSFDLMGREGETLIRVRQNSLSIDDIHVWDVRLNTYSNRLTIQPHQGRIALDLRLRRVTVDDLRSMAARDSELSARAMSKSLRKDDPSYDYFKNVSPICEHIDGLLRQASLCLDEDGRVPIISFEKAQLFGGRNGYVEIRKGVFMDPSQNMIGSCYAFRNVGPAFSFSDRQDLSEA